MSPTKTTNKHEQTKFNDMECTPLEEKNQRNESKTNRRSEEDPISAMARMIMRRHGPILPKHAKEEEFCHHQQPQQSQPPIQHHFPPRLLYWLHILILLVACSLHKCRMQQLPLLLTSRAIRKAREEKDPESCLDGFQETWFGLSHIDMNKPLSKTF